MSAIQQMLAGYGAAAGGDPNFANVTLLLHGDGVDGSTTFIDSSPLQLSPVSQGSVISTVNPKFGTGAILNTTGYIQLPYNVNLKLSTVPNFTVEFFVKVANTQTSDYSGIWVQDTPGSTYTGMMILATTQNVIQFWGSSSLQNWDYPSKRIGTCSLDVWHHVALTRSGSIVRGFFNGVKTLEFEASNIGFDSTNSQIGKYSGSPFNGRIDELRLTKGICRYTSDFTPPAAPFPNS